MPAPPASSSGDRSSVTPARITDVARAAGVSAQTVSNVLNERGGFTETTRDRVLLAARELRFTRNRAARHLRTQRSGQLGVHLPRHQLGVGDSFTINFLHAVIEAAEQVNQQVVIFTHPLDRHGLDDTLLAAGMDGFVLCNVDPSDPRPALLAAAGVPYALFGRVPEPLPQAWVDIDNRAAMATMVDHLVGRGHRRFGYVGFDHAEYWNAERLEGTRARLADHGLDLPEALVVTGSLAETRPRVADLLLGPRHLDALICASDSLALMVHLQASATGLRPGRDIAVTGFDGLPLAVELDPPLTSVRLPVVEAAEAVIQLILRQLDDDLTPLEGRFLPTGLALGGTA